MEYFFYVFYALIVWNIFVFLLYGADKIKAKKKMQRISERTLLVTAFCMGSVGAFLGMTLFRHKTKHWQFKVLLPLFAIINIAIIATVYYFILKM